MKSSTLVNALLIITWAILSFYRLVCAETTEPEYGRPKFISGDLESLAGIRSTSNSTGSLGQENESNLGEMLHYELPIPSDQQLDELKVPKACTPLLNWIPSNFNDRNANGSNQQRSEENNSEADRVNLSFAIADIEMPVAPASGSLNSAMKLMSAFDNPFGFDSESEAVESVVKFKENNLHIEGLNLSMLDVHLYPANDPKFGIGLTVRNTTLTGQFSYNGPLLITDSKLTGYYRMSIDNIYLIASSNLTKQQQVSNANGSAQGERSNVQFQLKSKDFKVNVTNLGYITIEVFDTSDFSRPTANYMLKILQRVLQRTIKRTYFSFESYIRETLRAEGEQFLDCELTRYNHLLDNSGASSHESDIARILSSEITRSQLSSVPLPNYEHQQNILGSMATIQFQNGSLSGLNNTRLNGETRIKLQDEHLFVNTSIGWFELRPQYNWSLIIGNSKVPISKGLVAFNIKGIDFDAVITKGLRPHTRIVVEQLTIRRLDSPKMDISGLPGMNRVTRGMVNFFMGRLKQRISSSIQPALKQQLERSLNKMNLFAQ